MDASDSSKEASQKSESCGFTPAQITAYFDRICLPACYRASLVFSNPGNARTIEHGLPLVEGLMRFQLSAIPFENLGLHYSDTRRISLEAADIYHLAITEGRGRGGHCLQLKALFGTILRSLGFEVMTGAARINTACQAIAKNPGYRGPSYNGWDHMINIVTMSERRYLVDVGMGAREPIVPLELVSGISATSIEPRSVRLRHDHIPEHRSSHPSNVLWVLEVQNNTKDAWIPTYAFPEVEFLGQDFEVFNWYISNNPRSMFVQKILVVRMILDSENEMIIGDISLDKETLVRRVHGKVELHMLCKSEHERVEVLRKWFGIELTDSEQKAIHATVTEIP